MNLRTCILTLLVCVLQLLLHKEAHAQETTTPQPTEQQWQQLTNDKAFGYKTEKEVLDKPKPKESNLFTNMVLLLFAFFSSGLGQALIWILFFLIAGWALYKIFFNERIFIWGKTSKKIKTEETITDPGLFDADWEAEMQKAIRENNIRMAIRYSYMRLLQILEQRGAIQYRADKTNHEYYHEISNEHKQHFRKLTRQYEYVWYGDLPISADNYNEYMNTFNTLKRSIGS